MVPVAVLTYGLWETHFGGDLAVTGWTANLDGHPVMVIGVLASAFRWGVSSVKIFEPIGAWLTCNPTASRGNRGDMLVVGRLAGEMGIGQARNEMEAIGARPAGADPEENEQFGVALRSIRDTLIGDTWPALLVLLGGLVCVLLIACANVANLCLTRGASGTREIALRIAIGANRGRIVSQLLVESAISRRAGGLFGLAFAVGGLPGLNRLMQTKGLWRRDDIERRGAGLCGLDRPCIYVHLRRHARGSGREDERTKRLAGRRRHWQREPASTALASTTGSSPRSCSRSCSSSRRPDGAESS